MTNPLQSIDPLVQKQQIQSGNKIDKQTSSEYPDFKTTLAGFMNDVNSMQSKADESIKKMASGQITDVHQVMNSVEEANLAFNMMMEIRNKVVDAYQEVMRLRF